MGKRKVDPTPPHDAGVSPPNTSPEMVDIMPPQKKVRMAHTAHPPTQTSRSSPKMPTTPPPLPEVIPNPPPPPPPDPSPSSPPEQTLKNWSLEFPVVQSVEDRKKYGSVFHSDYEEYNRCHTKLAGVSKEFADLERRLSKAPKETKERKKVNSSLLWQKLSKLINV